MTFSFSPKSENIKPIMVDEFYDSALMKIFGQTGIGIFLALTAMADDVEKQYDVVKIGETDELRKKYLPYQLNESSHIMQWLK